LLGDLADRGRPTPCVATGLVPGFTLQFFAIVNTVWFDNTV